MSIVNRQLVGATIEPLGGSVREGLQELASIGLRGVQISAMQHETRPRNLDRSARRDLVATLRRLELWCSGIDLWIPPEHFTKAETVDRAVSATIDALWFSREIDGGPVSVSLPATMASDVIESLRAGAEQSGVALADHGNSRERGEEFGVGIDPAAILSRSGDVMASIMAAGELLRSVRLCDVNASGMRCPPGGAGGRLDLVSMHGGLAAANYTGPVVIDARQWDSPRTGITQTLKAWQSTRVAW